MKYSAIAKCEMKITRRKTNFTVQRTISHTTSIFHSLRGVNFTVKLRFTLAAAAATVVVTHTAVVALTTTTIVIIREKD